MITIAVTRLSWTDEVTQSVVTVVDDGLVVSSHMALELPCRDNKRAQSRIPTGVYPFERHRGGRFDAPAKDVLLRKSYVGMPMVGNVPDRSYILAHWGNYPHDTDGCILIGTRFLPTHEPPMVTLSQAAFRVFYEAIRPALARPSAARWVFTDANPPAHKQKD